MKFTFNESLLSEKKQGAPIYGALVMEVYLFYKQFTPTEFLHFLRHACLPQWLEYGWQVVSYCL